MAAVLDKGTISFQAEGRLLQELGERLVASPEVALVELVKNAYDADSPSCQVRVEDNGKTLVIADKGHGMAFRDFADNWMRIATPSKVKDRVSSGYRRRLTGAKGIGRFAVRYLGSHLTLITVAEDKERGVKTKLTAWFDWPHIDELSDIRSTRVDYTLEEVSPDASTGTTLEIRELKSSADFTGDSSLRAGVLRIVSPLQALEAGRFKPAKGNAGKDPGFQVILPGGPQEETAKVDIAELVLGNAWAKLHIDLKDHLLTFNVWFPSSRRPKTLEVKVSTTISAGFVADIRYFPRRKGVFRAKGVNGHEAWNWVHANYGVAVVDHGFRVVPFGYADDDWLHLDLDGSRNRRDWRSKIATKHFPVPPTLRHLPADNPALYLPNNLQLVGAVFVESRPPSKARKEGDDLVPSMDREGFLKNKAFNELVEFVRAGIEFLAFQDKRELDRRLAVEARQAAEEAREDIRKAIDYIRRSPTLSKADKARFAKAYAQLAEQIEEVEEYHAQARRNLMVMSLLGVVAGFMTHETSGVVYEMEKAARLVSSLAKKHRDLQEVAAQLRSRLSAFKEQLQYAQMFLEGVRKNEAVRMSAAGQIRYVLKRFEGFARDHGIEVEWNAPAGVETPALPPAVYSGVLLNLFTNALKAVLATTTSIRNPKVAIRAWNERGAHHLEVSDNGVGIPPGLEKRIWDPLYTTTSDTGNPLGSGMGLGLTLVKQVVEDSGGKIELADEAPPGFNTCFRVVFPLG